MFSKKPLDKIKMPALLLLLAAIFISAQTEATENGSTLWKRAVGNSSSAGKLYPTLLVENETILNSDGNIEETSRTAIRVHNRNRNLACTLLSAKKNNEDLTGKEYHEVKQIIPFITTDDILASEILLFSKSNQRNIQYTLKKRNIKVGNRTCSTYSFRQKTRDNVWNGTAWIEERSGRPVKVVTRPGKIANDEKKLKVTSLYMVVHFGTVMGRYWHPNKVTVVSNFIYRPLPFVSFKGKSRETTFYKNFRKF